MCVGMVNYRPLSNIKCTSSKWIRLEQVPAKQSQISDWKHLSTERLRSIGSRPINADTLWLSKSPQVIDNFCSIGNEMSAGTNTSSCVKMLVKWSTSSWGLLRIMSQWTFSSWTWWKERATKLSHISDTISASVDIMGRSCAYSSNIIFVRVALEFRSQLNQQSHSSQCWYSRCVYDEQHTTNL